MYPRTFAQSTPNKPAVIMSSSGETLSFSELEAQANQAAHLFRSQGLSAGDRVAFVLENTPQLFVFAWGAQRAGLHYVAVSSRLTAGEIAYILEDSGARLVLSSDYIGQETLDAVSKQCPKVNCFKTGSTVGNWHSWDEARDKHLMTPIADESAGADMLYSSGTTGRPKGILPNYEPGQPVDTPNGMALLVHSVFNASDQSTYLCPAPLYHAAPLRWSMAMMAVGASVVVMEKFDAEHALQLIEKYHITHAQFVPTHFIRMLKLEGATRTQYDVSSLQVAIHAAAPCPVPVKEEMIPGGDTSSLSTMPVLKAMA